MPRLTSTDLVKAIGRAIDESGGSSVVVPPLTGPNPRHLIVQYDQQVTHLWVYVWTLTHGGGAARPADEYRIQMTGVPAPLPVNPDGPTILVGYEPFLGCFAGFDIRLHRQFTPGSPSIQIPRTTVAQAVQDGLAFTRKGNEEIAIGVRPDQFLAYALNAVALHSQGADAATLDLLRRAAALEPVDSEQLSLIPEERRTIVSTVSRLARAASFRNRVLTAYGQRCAVSGMQLNLVDAAHILPVGAHGSTDDVRNGLSLAATYHRAFDRGLIFLDSSLVMRVNCEREQELARLGLTGGIGDLKLCLNTRIHLPSNEMEWPAVDYIREANRYRGVNA